MILTYVHDQNMVKMKKLAKYLGEKSIVRSKVIVHTQTHNNRPDRSL